MYTCWNLVTRVKIISFLSLALKRKETSRNQDKKKEETNQMMRKIKSIIQQKKIHPILIDRCVRWWCINVSSALSVVFIFIIIVSFHNNRNAFPLYHTIRWALGFSSFSMDDLFQKSIVLHQFATRSKVVIEWVCEQHVCISLTLLALSISHPLIFTKYWYFSAKNTVGNKTPEKSRPSNGTHVIGFDVCVCLFLIWRICFGEQASKQTIEYRITLTCPKRFT